MSYRTDSLEPWKIGLRYSYGILTWDYALTFSNFIFTVLMLMFDIDIDIDIYIYIYIYVYPYLLFFCSVSSLFILDWIPCIPCAPCTSRMGQSPWKGRVRSTAIRFPVRQDRPRLMT